MKVQFNLIIGEKMQITKIKVRNFRLLQDSEMDFGTNLCLLLGRNNTGKTSFMVVLEKFLKTREFDFNDFSISLRKELFDFNANTDVNKLAIQLILNIEYNENDDLCNISDFLLDLDPNCKTINLLFECSIKKEKLLEDLKSIGSMQKEKYIVNNIKKFLQYKVFTFDSIEDLKTENRYKLIEKDFKDVEKLIDFEIIHAKRNVASSEEKTGIKVLSKLTTEYYNKSVENPTDKFEGINELMSKMDGQLNDSYKVFFANFLLNAKEFLNMTDLKVVSNLKAKEIINDSSEVVYGDLAKRLPEHLNGLGHMNILFLLLTIEIKKASFKNNNKDIKLLLIEEPEAHTHPQIQYIFARKIERILNDVPNLQTIISTHSPHMVSKHSFEDIRYMSLKHSENGDNIEIKNFHKELNEKYKDEQKEFSFLKQYLSVQSSELFFADKAIFIEGISEGILLDYFIKQYDSEERKKEEEKEKKDNTYKSQYIPLSAQNVTIVQVGANAKAFRYFIDFLNIPTLIITDIDTVYRKDGKKTTYPACAVGDPNRCFTSNATIKYYYDAPKYIHGCSMCSSWINNILNHANTCISDFVNVFYQYEENGYYPRSFEDAFINVNLTQLKHKKENLLGIKNEDELDENTDIYDLTQKIIDKKSDFASSLLYIAYTENNVEWAVPKYIKEGLSWLQKQ